MTRVYGCEHCENDRFFGRVPQDLVTEIINGDITNRETADVGEGL
jgi:hypothetical protein